MPIKAGRFHQLSNDAYHRGIGSQWMSKSNLAYFLEEGADTPRKWKHKQDHPEVEDLFDKKHLDTYNPGTAAHTKLLEPEKYGDEIAIIPTDINRRTNIGKEKWATFMDEVKETGKTPIRANADERAEGMLESLRSGYYETARKIIEAKDNFIEHSGFWIDPETGLWLKTRPDIIAMTQVLWDIKTYSTGFKPFASTAVGHHYDLQAFMGLRGVSTITRKNHTQFGFIVFFTEPPYDIEVWICGDKFLRSGEMKFNKALAYYNECKEKAFWPGLDDDVQTLFPPKWREIQMEKELAVWE